MKHKMSLKRATIIKATSKYTTILCNLLFAAVSARLLTPKDYGIVAVKAVFTNCFSLFSDMGIGVGMIRDKLLTRKETGGIFSLTMRVSTVLGVAFAVFFISMVVIYDNDTYKKISCLFAISLLFSTMNMVTNVLMMKNERFVLVELRNDVAFLQNDIMAIAFVLTGMWYYSLVLQSLLTSTLLFTWNKVNVQKEYLFRFQHFRQGLKKNLSYSGYQLAFSIVNYLTRNLDNQLVSKFMG